MERTKDLNRQWRTCSYLFVCDYHDGLYPELFPSYNCSDPI